MPIHSIILRLAYSKRGQKGNKKKTSGSSFGRLSSIFRLEEQAVSSVNFELPPTLTHASTLLDFECDRQDANIPTMVAEYVNDIYRYQKEIESSRAVTPYLHNSVSFNGRVWRPWCYWFLPSAHCLTSRHFYLCRCVQFLWTGWPKSTTRFFSRHLLYSMLSISSTASQ